MASKNGKKFLWLLILLLIGAFFYFDLGDLLTLERFRSQQQQLQQFYAANRLVTLAIYFCIYVLVTALSLPGATVMTLAGGALFGFWSALFVVSFASSIGATLAFLVARFLLRDSVQRRFGDKLRAINAGIEKEGAFYLFSLRLVPLFPFFVINLLMGLTPLRAPLFYLVSQIGMLPGTIVYVNAGTQLGKIDSAAAILSPTLLFSFVLLGLFPLVATRLLSGFKRRRALRGHARPKRFDYNLIVLGGGAAGLVGAYIGAAVKAKVALIEEKAMGGDCLNSGCVPSKALLKAATLVAQGRRASDFGLVDAAPQVDFAAVMARVRQTVAEVAPHDSRERYRDLGVDCLEGRGRIVSPFAVEVNGHTLTARAILVASGAAPLIPPLLGHEKIDLLTSENLWDLTTLPPRLLILGGGPIGCELAQAFARLGSAVTLVEMGARLLPREDAEVGNLLRQRLAADGVTVRTGHRAEAFIGAGESGSLCCRCDDETVEIAFDRVLVAVGRAPRLHGFGLEELGVRLEPRGIANDAFLQSSIPTIYCAGDVAGRHQFTHTAAHQAWYASVNALLGVGVRFRLDERVIPWCTFTDPEVARVGLSEEEAAAQGIAVEVSRYALADFDRAIIEGEKDGWIKVLTVPGKDRILGVCIVAPHAGELLAEFVLAMKHGLGLNKILATIHPYPSWADANKLTAGLWKKAHASPRLLAWAERFHRWRRGA